LHGLLESITVFFFFLSSFFVTILLLSSFSDHLPITILFLFSPSSCLSDYLITLYYQVGWKDFANARPNAGHYAVAALESKGIVTSVITQNVDRYRGLNMMLFSLLLT
jgi:Sir2 family